MKPRTYIIAVLVMFASILATRPAAADHPKQYRYVGIHPIPKGQGGGVCHIKVPHIHIYAPIDVKVQYRDHDGFKQFVGDPVAYGWDGPKYTYYGHHPIPVGVIDDDGDDVEYCYIEGPHYHAWAPAPEMRFEMKGGAYWYMGSFPKAYVEARPVYDPIDVVYEPIVYDRPVVAVEVAPVGWYGLAVVAPVHVHPAEVHGAVGAAVVVPAPAVRVEVHVPTVEIGVGAGIIVGGHPGRGHGKWKHKGRHW